MDYRALTVSAVIATGVVGFAPICRADIVASEDGIAVRDAGVAAPARGMTMSQVASKFGDPVSKVAAVGTPPISRWEYSGFVVYFERDHVIHAVVSGSAPPEASGAASAPSAAAPMPPVEAPAPASAPEPTAAPVEAPVAQAPATQAPVAQAPIARAEVPPAAPATAAAVSSTPDDSEAPAQP
jgi:hypothetical protein